MWKRTKVMETTQLMGKSSQPKVNEPPLSLLRPSHSFRKKGGLNLLFERRVRNLNSLSHLVTTLERGEADLPSSYSKEKGETQTQTQTQTQPLPL